MSRNEGAPRFRKVSSDSADRKHSIEQHPIRNARHFFGEQVLEKQADLKVTRRHPRSQYQEKEAALSVEIQASIQRTKVAIPKGGWLLVDELNPLLFSTAEKYAEIEIENWRTKKKTPQELADAKRSRTEEIYERLARGIIKGELPDQDWLAVITTANERFKKMETQLTEREPELRQRFKERFDMIRTKYNLLLSDSEIASRIDSLKFGFRDRIEAVQMNHGAFDATYVQAPHMILFSYFEGEDSVEHIFTHEMFHGTGGKTLIQGNDEVREEQNFFKDASVLPARSGLSFFVHQGRKGLRNEFLWLDEAVTEQLTIECLGDAAVTDKIYKLERELLKALCESGKNPIPFKEFVHAYFENYVPNEDGSATGVPQWRSLMATINAQYEPGFLQDIEKIVDTEGPEKAIEYAKGFKDTSSQNPASS